MKKTRFWSFEELLYHYHLHGNFNGYELPKLRKQEHVWFFNGMLGIINELKKNDISTSDYINIDNLGIKHSGNLGMFDFGFGDNYHVDDELETLMFEKRNLLKNILKRIGVEKSTYLGGGHFGYAHDINNGLVLKITKDKSEAVNSNKIKGKKNEFLSDISDVMKFKMDEIIYYIIILEKLSTPKFLKKIYKEIEEIVSKRYNNNLISPALINKIKIKHRLIGEFLEHICKYGYSSAWDKYRDMIKQDKSGYDFNDISDISYYVDGSVTLNVYKTLGIIPKHIKILINELIK